MIVQQHMMSNQVGMNWSYNGGLIAVTLGMICSSTDNFSSSFTSELGSFGKVGHPLGKTFFLQFRKSKTKVYRKNKKIIRQSIKIENHTLKHTHK